MKKQMIILEQPTEWGGKGIPVPPQLIGKVDQTKYDVSTDGKWMKPKDNTQTNNLPSWVPDCLKSEFTLKKTTDTTQVMSSFNNGSKQYFWEDGNYRYVKNDGNKVNGKYSCVNDKLYINTVSEDGEIFYDGKWKTLIEDEDLLDTIKKGGVVVDIIKSKFLDLLDVSKAYTFEKIEELKKWWKEHKKNQNNNNDNNSDNDDLTPLSTDWRKDPTGSKMYVYQVNKNCKWLAKNVKTGEIFNISDNPKYDSSVQILNKKLSDLIKNCNSSNTQTDDSQNDGGQTIITPPKPTPPPVVLPDWAKCIGDSIVGANVTKDENGLDIVFSLFGKSKGYFWDDGTFMFVYENGNKVAGKWSCDNNKLLIRTEDGEQWTPSTQWTTQPSKYINPSVNNSTTGVNITDVVGDESTPTETTKSDKQDSSAQFKAVDLPKDIGFKPSKPDITNESYNPLENVLNNVNSLINEIEMKEIIKEQKQSVVNAPAEELDILYRNAVLKTMGTVETLCESGPTPIPVNVGGRMYFAGRKTALKGLSASEGYIVYDGRIIARTQGCNFVYVKKGNDIVEINGIEKKVLELPKKELLSRFGVDNMDYNSNPYYFIDTITKKFNNLIDKGGRSSIFRSWQELLMNYYKYDNTKRLKLTTDNENDPPQDEMNKFEPLSADKLGIQFNDRQIKIYLPKGAGVTSGFTGATYNADQCRTDLVSYLSAAFEFQVNGGVDSNINSSTVRNNLRACYRSGKFQNMTPITSTDIKVDFVDKDNPFKGMRGFGSEFKIKEVQKLLGGETFKLPKVGPNGKNPFLPFIIDSRQTMRESKLKLNNLIKENLTKIKREKDSSLLIETKIIKSRTQLLSENRILKFKQPREKFFNEIISEAMYLNKQGFDKQIIKEEFWDSLKGLFGEHGSNAIFTTFKEYMGKYLVGKLTSINPNGWMGENIKNAINKIHIEDLDKITDCDFISRKISTSITDSIISKVSKGQDIEGGNISSIVKGGLDKSIDRTELTKNIHEGITKLICPVLGDVSKKLKEKGEEMKLKAVRP
jgi:hypothetical protein